MIWRVTRKNGDKHIKSVFEHVKCVSRNGHPQYTMDAMVSHGERLEMGWFKQEDNDDD